MYALATAIKDKGLSIERDHVDLAVPGACVAGEDREAETLQVSGGQLLAEAAEGVAGVLGRRVWAGSVAAARICAGGARWI